LLLRETALRLKAFNDKRSIDPPIIIVNREDHSRPV
jgi:hypothetical protein